MGNTTFVEKCIEILRWCINNKKSLGKGTRHFDVADSYIRVCKRKHGHKTNDPSVREFLTLYNNFLGIASEVKKPEAPESDDRGPVDKEEVKFYQEPFSGVIDAKGFNDIKTLDQLLKEAKVDLSVWEVERHLINKWDVTIGVKKFEDGKPTGTFPETYQNWQVKVWLKRIKTEEEIDHFNRFVTTISEYAPKYKAIKYSNKDKKYAFELSLPDLHIGKLAWAPESGQNYDIKIAIDRYTTAVSELLTHVEHIKGEIAEIILPVGNDLFNVDSAKNETANGTPQHADVRWQKMFLKGKEMLIQTIDQLSLIAPVKVIMVSGNHDYQTVFYLGECFRAWYRNAKYVTIDNAPSQRKYYAYGKNLTMFTHGNEEKHNDIGLIVANEQPEMWFASVYRQAHLGHFHKKKETRWVDTDEFQGFKVKIIPSLSSSDAWHRAKGYMSHRSAIGILYHKERGPVAEYSYNVGDIK